MKCVNRYTLGGLVGGGLVCTFLTLAQTQPSPENRSGDRAAASAEDSGPPDSGPGFGPPPGFDGPPGFGGRGFGPGPGGPGMSEIKLVKKFDKDGDNWLNAEERKAAREYLSKEGANQGRRGPGGPGGFRRGGTTEAAKPGPRLTPADVKSFTDEPLYASNVVRTFFLEFENSDWEKELADFKNTDVEVPAKVTVDGKTYEGVGVHFHGMSSFMMVPEGEKRSLVLSFDFLKKHQQIGGYHTLNLLNSHEDPSFLRTVLSLQVARDYLPAPKANFARVVINGECWGIYVNQQHFNKDFVRDSFGTTKGARWKVPGSPNGRGGLEYLGDNAEAYKRIYEIKSKDDPESWAAFIKLCKVLNQTPAANLEVALTPLFDIDGVLKFLAWDNALSSGDGFWTRASDYCLYLDEKGKFHVVPYDANETFSLGGGPGGPGGPGGMRGPGGPGGFGPGAMFAEQIFSQADKDKNQKLSKDELVALGDTWFDKLDPQKSGKVSQEQFADNLEAILPTRGGFPGGPGGGRGGFNPGRFLSRMLFSAFDDDKNGSLTRDELKATLSNWFVQADKEKAGAITAEALGTTISEKLPRPDSMAQNDRRGGPGGRRGGPGGFPGGPGAGGVQLDPLVAVNDSSKSLISKLLAVPSLRERYLKNVKTIAAEWLDWNKLGPVAQAYHDLIAPDVKVDTRKLDSTSAFDKSLDESLKAFAEKRRAYLMTYTPAGKSQ